MSLTTRNTHMKHENSNNQSRVLKKIFETIVGKGENPGNQHFLLLPQCFLLFLEENLSL